VLKHAVMLKAILTTFPLHTIFVVVKFENRTNIMIQNFEDAIDPIIKTDLINKLVYDEKLKELEGNLGHRNNFEKNNKFIVSEEIKEHDTDYWENEIVQH
jgi:hypothetical protein